MKLDPDDETMDEDLMVCKADTIAQSIHERIKNETDRDEELQMVKEYILNGWPSSRNRTTPAANLCYEY